MNTSRIMVMKTVILVALVMGGRETKIYVDQILLQLSTMIVGGITIFAMIDSGQFENKS